MPKQGQEHHAAKLTDQQVRAIFVLRDFLHHAEVARMFGVSVSYVHRVWTREVRRSTTADLDRRMDRADGIPA